MQLAGGRESALAMQLLPALANRLLEHFRAAHLQLPSDELPSYAYDPEVPVSLLPERCRDPLLRASASMKS